MWNADPVILLFSDRVDSAVKHYHHTQSERPVDPGPVIAKLLGDDLDHTEAGAILGHTIIPKWNVDGNKAVEILGNLFGVSDAERIQKIIAIAASGTTAAPNLPFDDTTLILYSPSQRNEPGE